MSLTNLADLEREHGDPAAALAGWAAGKPIPTVGCPNPRAAAEPVDCGSALACPMPTAHRQPK
eukprot:3362119-Prymnesium_polylepis.1